MEYESVEAMDGKSPIILKAIPKTSIIVKLRRNSCLYPSFARFNVRGILPSTAMKRTQDCGIILVR